MWDSWFKGIYLIKHILVDDLSYSVKGKKKKKKCTDHRPIFTAYVVKEIETVVCLFNLCLYGELTLSQILNGKLRNSALIIKNVTDLSSSPLKNSRRSLKGLQNLILSN